MRGAGAEERAERLQYVAVALEELPERLRHLLRGYFIEQRPIAVVAAQVEASEARAEQLLVEGLRLLDALGAVDPAAEADPGPASGRTTAYVRIVAARYAARSAPATVTEVAQRASAWPDLGPTRVTGRAQTVGGRARPAKGARSTRVGAGGDRLPGIRKHRSSRPQGGRRERRSPR